MYILPDVHDVQCIVSVVLCACIMCELGGPHPRCCRIFYNTKTLHSFLKRVTPSSTMRSLAADIFHKKATLTENNKLLNGPLRPPKESMAAKVMNGA